MTSGGQDSDNHGRESDLEAAPAVRLVDDIDGATVRVDDLSADGKAEARAAGVAAAAALEPDEGLKTRSRSANGICPPSLSTRSTASRCSTARLSRTVVAAYRSALSITFRST